jgi:hypothetical protein
VRLLKAFRIINRALNRIRLWACRGRGPGKVVVHDRIGSAISRHFRGIVRTANRDPFGVAGADRSGFLLHNVGQLVRHQAAVLKRVRRIISVGHHDVFTDGIGMRTDGCSRVSGTLIGVNPNAREVLTEARLEEVAR